MIRGSVRSAIRPAIRSPIALEQGGGVAGPTPNELFDALIVTYSPIYAFNVADAATRWRDTSGTLPATAAGSHTLGRLDDKSANSRNVSQASSPARPALGNSGDLWWAEGDGIDDTLVSASFAYSQPWWRFSALRQLGQPSQRLMGPISGQGGFLLQNTAATQLVLYDGTLAASNSNAPIGSDVTLLEVHNGASSSITVDATTPTTGNAGTSAVDGLSIFSPNVFSKMRLYATIAGSGTLTAPQIAEIRTVMALLQGRTL